MVKVEPYARVCVSGLGCTRSAPGALIANNMHLGVLCTGIAAASMHAWDLLGLPHRFHLVHRVTWRGERQALSQISG